MSLNVLPHSGRGQTFLGTDDEESGEDGAMEVMLLRRPAVA